MNVNVSDITPYVEEDEHYDSSELDGEALLKWNRDELIAYSVYAEVELEINIGFQSDYIVNHTVRSPGLHGVILDVTTDTETHEYISEVFEEERDTLISMLIEMGIGVQKDS